MQYDVSVDKYNLDEESLHIPAAFDMFQTKESEASEQWDTLKDKMRVVQADVSLEIRGWPLEKINSFYGKELTKLTEEVYKQLVFIHPEVISLYNEIAIARNNTLIFQAARKAIEKKAEALDRLSKLHGQGYFMKIEGRPYKKFSYDAVLDQAKRTIIKRLENEKSLAPPKLTGKTTKKTLKAAEPPKLVNNGPERIT
jgi:hypothetical protein